MIFPGFKLLDRFLIRVWEGWGYCTVPGLDTVQLPALRQQCTWEKREISRVVSYRRGLPGD